ncbi:hypothetical protein IAT38_007699 [Cryptococcus sp. DSM 104549]
MAPYSLLFPLVVRTLLTLPFPHTYFQPDEFYQALEPAHNHVFGYGYLTWEWRDLPVRGVVGEGLEAWWAAAVDGGRMRGWAWPGVFVGVYEVLKRFGLDHTALLLLAPRIIGVAVAAFTDFYTYRLSSKVLGTGSAPAAIFLSLTSLFNAHLLPRSLSTSPETLLTLMALYYFPLPRPTVPTLNDKALQAGVEMQQIIEKGEMAGLEDSEETFGGVNELNYVVMDRMSPFLGKQHVHKDKLWLSICLATLALCIRPTTLSLWAFLGTALVWRTFKTGGVGSAFLVIGTAVLSAAATFVASTSIDYAFTGRLYFPILNFIHQNLVLNISSFYGSTNILYHLTQSLPIMLFPIWFWWGPGFLSALLPSSVLPKTLARLDSPPGLRLLARAITFSIATLSLSPHSEWRFLHPFLPPLLLFAIPSFSEGYTPTVLGIFHFTRAARQFTRISKLPFYAIMFAPVVPFVYLNVWHGGAQVEVMNVLRRGELGEVSGLVVLAPCHSVPWMSHLHKDVEGWFLTCEPPLEVTPESHTTQQEWFYDQPIGYLSHVFPYPPDQLHNIPKTRAFPALPSHIILFGELLSRAGTVVELEEQEDGEVKVTDRKSSVRGELERKGYEEVWSGWNGFDWAQDEDERKGGVRVWKLI